MRTTNTGEFVQGLDKYDVPLFDMLMFLKDQLDSHNISLDDMDEASLNDIFSQLDMAQKQLKSDRYSRMVVYLNLPEESDETFAFLTEMRNIVGKYYDGDYYVVGNSTSSRDLSSSFVKDNLVISHSVLPVRHSGTAVHLPVGGTAYSAHRLYSGKCLD